MKYNCAQSLTDVLPEKKVMRDCGRRMSTNCDGLACQVARALKDGAKRMKNTRSVTSQLDKLFPFFFFI